MLNQVVLVGRLTQKPNIIETENGKKIAHLNLAVPRSFKNVNGAYDTDFIDCILWDNIASNTSEYCNKGDIVGIKGRLQTSSHDNQLKLELIAEKVTFLSSNKNNENDIEQERE